MKQAISGENKTFILFAFKEYSIEREKQELLYSEKLDKCYTSAKFHG